MKDKNALYGYLQSAYETRPYLVHAKNIARKRATKKNAAKLAVLDYRLLATSVGGYHLLEVQLHTGRHHQIRCQLAHIGCPIKGDLKYGAPRSNPDGSISLHAYRVSFEHPVRHEQITVEAPAPWRIFEGIK